MTTPTPSSQQQQRPSTIGAAAPATSADALSKTDTTQKTALRPATVQHPDSAVVDPESESDYTGDSSTDDDDDGDDNIEFVPSVTPAAPAVPTTGGATAPNAPSRPTTSAKCPRPSTGGKRIPPPSTAKEPKKSETDDEDREDSSAVRHYDAELGLAPPPRARKTIATKKPTDPRRGSQPPPSVLDVFGGGGDDEDDDLDTKDRQLEMEMIELSKGKRLADVSDGDDAGTGKKSATDKKKTKKPKTTKEPPKKKRKTERDESDKGPFGPDDEDKDAPASKKGDEKKEEKKKQTPAKPKKSKSKVDPDKENAGRRKRKYVPKSRRRVIWGTRINPVIIKKPADADKKPLYSSERASFTVVHFASDNGGTTKNDEDEEGDYEDNFKKGDFVLYNEAAARVAEPLAGSSPVKSGEDDDADEKKKPKPPTPRLPLQDEKVSIFRLEPTYLDGVSKGTQTRLRQAALIKCTDGVPKAVPSAIGDRPTLVLTQRCIMLDENTQYRHEFLAPVSVAVDRSDEEAVRTARYVLLSDCYAKAEFVPEASPSDDAQAKVADATADAARLKFTFVDPEALEDGVDWIGWLGDNHFTKPPPEALFRHENPAWDVEKGCRTDGRDSAAKPKKAASSPRKKKDKKTQEAKDDAKTDAPKPKKHQEAKETQNKDKTSAKKTEEDATSKPEKKKNNDDDAKKPKHKHRHEDKESKHPSPPKKRKHKDEPNDDGAPKPKKSKSSGDAKKTSDGDDTIFLPRNLTSAKQAFAKLRDLVGGIDQTMAPTMEDLQKIIAYAWAAIGK